MGLEELGLAHRRTIAPSAARRSTAVDQTSCAQAGSTASLDEQRVRGGHSLAHVRSMRVSRSIRRCSSTSDAKSTWGNARGAGAGRRFSVEPARSPRDSSASLVGSSRTMDGAAPSAAILHQVSSESSNDSRSSDAASLTSTRPGQTRRPFGTRIDCACRGAPEVTRSAALRRSLPVRRVMGPPLRRVMGPGRRSERPGRRLPRIGLRVHRPGSRSTTGRAESFSQGHGATRRAGTPVGWHGEVTFAASHAVGVQAASSPVSWAAGPRPRSSV